jgi:hypothetical protein
MSRPIFLSIFVLVSSLLLTTHVHADTRGHAQVGMAVFDRSGQLADEHESRGFSPFGGSTLRLGFIHYLTRVPWLGFGAGVRGTFGNSSHEDGREYYMNPIFTSATIAAFAPLGPHDSGFDVQLDVGVTNVLAKLRTPNASGGFDVFHEYGIGLGVGLLVGYRLDFGAATALTLSVQHSRHWAGVEEPDATSKTWALGTTVFMAGFSFGDSD